MKSKTALIMFIVLFLSWTILYQFMLSLMLKLAFFTSLISIIAIWWSTRKKIKITEVKEKGAEPCQPMIRAVKNSLQKTN